MGGLRRMDEGAVFPGSALTASRFAEFLSQAYMGSDRQFGVDLQWGRCLHRAYLDFSRTLRGFAGCPEKSERLQAAASWLENRIAILDSSDRPVSQASFDTWHLETRRVLEERLGTWKDGAAMQPGQSQKWVNMSLKYIYTLEALGVVRNFTPLRSGYKYAHLPLDRYVLSGLHARGCGAARRWVEGWSTLDNDSYLDIQNWSRKHLADGKSLLDLDWELWSSRSWVPLTSA